MKIGDLVFNKYHGIIRFGTIKTKRIDENGWAYFKIVWHSDHIYEDAMTHREKLTRKKHKLQEYRADQISLASKSFLSNVLREHESALMPSNRLNTNGLCPPSAKLSVI